MPPIGLSVPPKPAPLGSLKLSVLESILDSLHFGVSVRDHRLDLLYANPSWAGRDHDGNPGASGDGARRSFLTEEARLARSVRAEGKALTEHVSIPDHDGGLKHYKLVVYPLAPGTRSTAIVSVSVEVSDVVRSGELREELFHMLAHDVGNHAIAVVRNLELLLDGVAGAPTLAQAEVLRATRECGNVLAGMTSDIQDVTLFEAGQMRLRRTRFCLSETIEVSVKQCQGLGLDRRIRIEFLPQCREALVFADRRRIERVLINLVMNAIQFSPPGGRVRVACGPCARRGWVVEVEDDGPGIPREYREAVFRKYFRVVQPGAPLRSGLGLGLYFCKQTVRSHGGHIWIESPPLEGVQGTRLLFSLPRAQEERS